MTKNVTILTDENGVQREYTEVRRKANVGERVKVVLSDRGMRPRVGDVVGVVRSVDDDLVEGNVTSSYMCSDNYVVLEPTSTVIIDGVRYREEKRKARVGERILIVNGDGHTPSYRNGTVLTVTRVYGDAGVFADAPDGNNVGVFATEYVVLAPIIYPVTKPSAQISITVNVTVASMDDAVQAVADAVKAEISKLAVAHPKSKSAQELRDEIVERAKRDVEYYASIYGYSQAGYYVDFVVNREKRTIVALIRDPLTDEVFARGIAKCAPGDVFNSHIGRAIALRRALGLEVPAEYLNAPQPTEVRVGDVVKYDGRTRTVVRGGVTPGKTCEIGSVTATYGKVIDDSRDQTEVSAIA